MHYARWQRYGSLDLPVRFPKGCSVTDCDERHFAKGFCRLHYSRWHKNGTTELVGWAAQIKPNPWAGKRPCPTCASSDWTLPFVGSLWRCVSCSEFFSVAEAVAA